MNQRQISRVLLALACVPLLGLSACNRSSDDPVTAAENRPPPDNPAMTRGDPGARTPPPAGAERSGAAKAENPAAKTADKAKDSEITSKVSAALSQDPSLAPLKVEVATNAGRVSLRGAAPDDSTRTRATLLAQQVDGVAGVDNQLTVH